MLMSFFKLMLFVALLFMPVLTWAKGPSGVAHGLHNLSASGVDPWMGTEGSSLYASNTEQVCVFCHTPHGGSLLAPLWNRGNPGGSFTHYNSATMSIDPGLAVNRTPNMGSYVCLSCHDGSISVYHVTNQPGDLNGQPITGAFGGSQDVYIESDIITGGPGKRIGGSQTTPAGTGDLSDDHPISFSYDQVLLHDDYKAVTGFKFGTLKTVANAEISGVEFFPPGNSVECASCHDVHVDYLLPSGDPAYEPFLIMPNTGSALCLACHVK
jgi:cytochrome c553